MNNNFVLMPLLKLRSHEAIDQNRLKVVLEKIKTDGFFIKPIIIEREEFIILDGHHRVAALKRLGAKVIPAYIVDYQSRDIRVFLRRKELMGRLTKEIVIKLALEGKVFPSKTTRHYLKNRPGRIKVSLGELY